MDGNKQTTSWLAVAIILPLGISGLAAVVAGIVLSDWELIIFGSAAFGLFVWILGAVGPIRRETTIPLSSSQVIAAGLAFSVGELITRWLATGRFHPIEPIGIGVLAIWLIRSLQRSGWSKRP